MKIYVATYSDIQDSWQYNWHYLARTLLEVIEYAPQERVHQQTPRNGGDGRTRQMRLTGIYEDNAYRNLELVPVPDPLGADDDVQDPAAA